MAGKETKQKERYLKIPYHILNIEGLGLSEKVLLAHIYSFGTKGCWQSNATLAKCFMTSQRTVRRWLANIISAGLVQIKSPKGYYRTIWARSHPDVKKAAQLYYKGKAISKKDIQNGRKCPARMDKNGRLSRPKSVSRHGQKCPTTNNITIKETIEVTTATPSPCLPGGQAAALLDDRRKADIVKIEKFKKSFGNSRLRRKPLTSEEFENKRQQQLKAFLSSSGIENKSDQS